MRHPTRTREVRGRTQGVERECHKRAVPEQWDPEATASSPCFKSCRVVSSMRPPSLLVGVVPALREMAKKGGRSLSLLKSVESVGPVGFRVF